MPFSICLFPSFDLPMDVARYMQELYWHLKPKKVIDKIYIPLSSRLYTLTDGGKKMPPITPNFFDASLFGNDFYNSEIFEFFDGSIFDEWEKRTERSQVVMNHSLENFKNAIASDNAVIPLLYGKEFINIGANENQFALYELLHIINRHSKTFPEVIQISKNIIKEIKPELTAKNKMYLFGSGPSISKAFEFDFSDGTTIVCNSTIADDNLINHIKPNFIACIDMILHIGCSKYASAYRNKLIEVMEKHNSYLITRLAFYDYLKASLPNNLISRIIAVPEYGNWLLPYNTDLCSKLYVADTGNVLTFAMLPFAATFAKEINVLGMDGKAPDDEEPLWNYYATDTLKPYMKHIGAAYPAYYYRDNTSYIKNHEKRLEDLTNIISNNGVKIKSLAKSYIPAFARFY